MQFGSVEPGGGGGGIILIRQVLNSQSAARIDGAHCGKVYIELYGG